VQERIETCKENDAREAEAELEARVETLVQQRLAQLRLENGAA